MRDDRQAEAGLSQMRRPARRARSRMSCLVRPASSRGAATPCWRAACWPGRIIALIVSIHPIGNDVEIILRAKFFHHSEELILAEEASRRVVLAVLGAFHLAGLNDGQRNALFLREGDGVTHLRAGQAGRVGKHGQHVLAQFAMRGPGEESGVDSSRISHQHATQSTQVLVQRLRLGVQDVDRTRDVGFGRGIVSL